MIVGASNYWPTPSNFVITSTNYRFAHFCDYIMISKILNSVSACVNIAEIQIYPKCGLRIPNIQFLKNNPRGNEHYM
jgi:hypothetical protein